METYQEYSEKNNLENKPSIKYKSHGRNIKITFLGEDTYENIIRNDFLNRKLNNFAEELRG